MDKSSIKMGNVTLPCYSIHVTLVMKHGNVTFPIFIDDFPTNPPLGGFPACRV